MKVYAINDRFFVSAIKHFEKVGRLEKEIDRLQTIIDNLEDEADHYYKKSELFMSYIKKGEEIKHKAIFVDGDDTALYVTKI